MVPKPAICLRPERPLLQNFVTFVHELTHFKGSELFLDHDSVLDYRDENDFAEKELMRAGGEFEAYTASGRIVKRLKKKSWIGVNWGFEPFFDHDGALTDREGLARFILDQLDYRTDFKNEFRERVVSRYNTAVEYLDYDQKVLRPQQARNLQNATRNEAIYRTQLTQLVQRKAPQARIEVLNRKIQDSQRAARFFQQYLKDLDEEIISYRKEIAEIDSRFGQYFAPR